MEVTIPLDRFSDETADTILQANFSAATDHIIQQISLLAKMGNITRVGRSWDVTVVITRKDLSWAATATIIPWDLLWEAMVDIIWPVLFSVVMADTILKGLFSGEMDSITRAAPS
jgi:hypothetical protein